MALHLTVASKEMGFESKSNERLCSTRDRQASSASGGPSGDLDQPSLSGCNSSGCLGTADCRKQGLPMVLYEHQYPRLPKVKWCVLWEEELQRSWWEGNTDMVSKATRDVMRGPVGRRS